MKRTLLTILPMVMCAVVNGQEVVSSQGASYSNSNGSVDLTIGEPVIITGTDGTNDITQGFHQTIWTFVGIEDHLPAYEVTIFPNPTEDVLFIKTEAFEQVTFDLYDSQGKLILQDVLSSEQTPVQVSDLSSGKYSLVLRNKEQKIKTFQLIKVQ